MINNNNNLTSNDRTNIFKNNPFSKQSFTNNNQIKEQNPTPKHNTSQNHKTPSNKYSINPINIPRPSQDKEIFINKDKTSIYQTNIGSLPPYSTNFFILH